jgi:aspartyl/asparaginyl beta-hydroxylase (cupin superfamily)
LGNFEQKLQAVLNMARLLPEIEPAFNEAEAETRLRANRHDIIALVAKADHLFLAKDHRAANSFYAAAARVVDPAPGSQSSAAHAQIMVAWLAEQFKQHMLTSLKERGFGEESRHPRFQKSLETMLGMRERPPVYERFPQLPMLYFYPDLPYVQFVDPSDFTWRKPLEAAFPEMRREALALLGGADDFQPYIQTNTTRPQGDVHGLIDNPDWSTFHLFENGQPVAEHVARCPKIFNTVMKHVPLCKIGPRAPSIMLSLLRPHAKIPPHTGMLNCRYICHLPLVIPPECGFRVGSESRKWREGEMLVFDDTVEHEAWNESDLNRLVLIFDIWHPELEADEQSMVQALFETVDQYE